MRGFGGESLAARYDAAEAEQEIMVSVPLRGFGGEREHLEYPLPRHQRVSVPLRGFGGESGIRSSNKDVRGHGSGFRPLAGIWWGKMVLRHLLTKIPWFPSPCGDLVGKDDNGKLEASNAEDVKFPSPCGDLVGKAVRRHRDW